jgi:hypothetical protein
MSEIHTETGGGFPAARHVYVSARSNRMGEEMQNAWIARVGLCAAAAVLAASLGILIFQNMNNSSPLRSIAPAQIQSSASAR